MSSLRLPRWTALLLLPLLAGALLSMHGLGAGATDARPHAQSAEHAHVGPGEARAEHRDAGCDDCAVGHVMVACVAIVVTVAGVRLARRAVGTREPALAATAIEHLRAARKLLRPPEPAWVRLGVMRC